MHVSSKAEVKAIPDHAFDVGFSKFYQTTDGNILAVPSGTTVPPEWTLLSD